MSAAEETPVRKRTRPAAKVAETGAPAAQGEQREAPSPAPEGESLASVVAKFGKLHGPGIIRGSSTTATPP